MIPVRQSTAFECAIGPVLDADGVAVTNCVVGDFKIKKTTGNFAALNGSATLTHVSAGFYDLVLTTSDTDTVGLACIAIDDTTNGCAPLYLQVIEEAVYDVWYAASATGAVLLQATQTGVTIPTVTTLTNAPSDPSGVTTLLSRVVGTLATGTHNPQSGDAFARIGVNGAGLTALPAVTLADAVLVKLGVLASGTAVSAAAGNVVLASGDGAKASVGGMVAVYGSDQAKWQWRFIENIATDTVTVSAWDATPTGTITYNLYGLAPSSGTMPAPVNVTQVAGTTQTAGDLAALINALPAGVLAAATANPIDANVQEINDVAITGDGSTTPFDVA